MKTRCQYLPVNCGIDIGKKLQAVRDWVTSSTPWLHDVTPARLHMSEITVFNN